MLRFERKSRNREVSISLRGKEKLLNSVFLTAFGIALGLHIGGWVVFQVTPFRLAMVNTVLSPVIVRADTSQKTTGLVFASAENEESVIQISKPPFTTPRLPEIPSSDNISFDPGEP